METRPAPAQLAPSTAGWPRIARCRAAARSGDSSGCWRRRRGSACGRSVRLGRRQNGRKSKHGGIQNKSTIHLHFFPIFFVVKIPFFSYLYRLWWLAQSKWWGWKMCFYVENLSIFCFGCQRWPFFSDTATKLTAKDIVPSNISVRKSPFLIGKPSISIRVIFNSHVTLPECQSVNIHKSPYFPYIFHKLPSRKSCPLNLSVQPMICRWIFPANDSPNSLAEWQVLSDTESSCEEKQMDEPPYLLCMYLDIYTYTYIYIRLTYNTISLGMGHYKNT